MTSVATVTPSEIDDGQAEALAELRRLVQPATQHGPGALEVRGDLEILVGRHGVLR